MKKRLTPKEVIFNINLNDGEEFLNIKDIPEVYSALNSIRKAVSIKSSGYNLYLIDTFSLERVKKIKEYVKRSYNKEEAPRDICYGIVENEKEPEAFILGNGCGNELRDALDELKNNYTKKVLDFYEEETDSDKDNIIDDVNKEKSILIDKIMKISEDEGFELKITKEGFAFVPLKGNKTMTEKEYDLLTSEDKDEISDNALKLKLKAEKILEKVKQLEDDCIKKLKEIYTEYLSLELEDEKKNLIINYLDNGYICEYLEEVYFNIERELVDCYTMNLIEDEKYIQDILTKYDFHVLVDNSKQIRPPVIYEDNPSITNLIGNIEYEGESGGGYSVSLSSIVPGSLVRANDGCLIVRLSDLISNPARYNALKKVLLNRKVEISSSKNYLDIITVNGLSPRKIPLNVKVIIIGDEESYDILYSADEEFKMLFPIRVKINSKVEIKNINWKSVREYIKDRFKKYSTLKLTDEALKETIKYLVRISDSRDKISLDYNDVDKILVLAATEAKESSSKRIYKNDITKVLYKEEDVLKEINKMYFDGKILIRLEGTCIGSINALAVIDTGYYKFGKPIRITSVVAKGDGRIIDSQKESSMSGNTFEKSISILTGLLNNMFASYKRLPVDFYLSFEQTYGAIDGDSASVAEIISILSSLSKIGIKQNMAITGSINQFGEIQPIGGVNEKIEGFYKVSKTLGKNIGSSVIIPASNKDEIILNEEVEESIRKGEFFIYTIETLDDAIEIMMIDKKITIKEFYEEIKKEIDKWR